MATTAAPYGFWATNPTKKLAHWVYLLGQPLSRNRVFQNFSGEPPPPPLNNINLEKKKEQRKFEWGSGHDDVIFCLEGGGGVES